MYAWAIGQLIRYGYRQAIAGNPAMVVGLAADDLEFVFPGDNSFAGTYRGKEELRTWLLRYASLHPVFRVVDVVVSGAPWNMRIAVRFADTIGDDYRNEGTEYLRLHKGRLRHLQVFLNTETISAWEGRHPEVTTAGGGVPASGK